MANPIKTSDIYQDDGGLKKLAADLEAVRVQYEALKKQAVSDAAALEKSTRSLNETRADERDQITENAKATDELHKRLGKYAEALEDNAVKLAAVKNAQNQLNNINKNEAKLIASKEGSYNRLSAQYSLNKIRLNQMSAEERSATEEGKKLEKETFEIYQEMKRLQEVTGKHVLSVGDYTKATREAGKEQKRLVAELEQVTEAFEDASASGLVSAETLKQYEAQIKDLTEQIDNLGSVTGKTSKDFKTGFVDSLADADGAAGQLGRGIQGVKAAFKALLANPIILFIAAIAGAVITLFNAFKRSEKGADLMAKASGVVNAVLSELTDVAVKVVDAITHFAQDPLEGIKNLGKSILENILNRFKAIPLITQAALKAMRALWERDWDAMKTAGQDALSAVNQAISGLDADQQKAIGAAIRETTKDMIDQAAAFANLEAAKRSTIKTNRELLKSADALITSEEVNAAIAEDNTKSFEERNKAAEKSREALEKRSALEVKVARNNLALVNQEIGLRRKNQENVEELLDRQLDAYRELAGAERNYTLAVRGNEKTRAELKQDQLEKDLDILIDGFDNQKTVNERIIKDQARPFEERAKLLQETANLADTSFLKQIETIQKFTGAQVNANELIAESDAVALNQKIRSLGLSEIIEGRLLEIVRERRLAALDLYEAEQALNEERAKALKAQAEAEKAANKQRYDIGLEAFDQVQALRESELDLVKQTEAEKTRIQLQAQRDRLAKMLALDEAYVKELNAIQIATIENQIKAIDKKIGEIDAGGINDIYDLFGFDLDDPQKQAINESFAFAAEQLNAYLEKRVETAAATVEQSKSEVEAAQANVNAQIEAGNLGYANKFDTAQKELELAKKTQAKALEEQRKAQRAQQAIQAIEQAGNMITASSKIWSTLGFPLAIPALAIMWGSFLAAQVKAFNTTRQFKEGGFEIMNYGGSHASGHDISLGVGPDKSNLRAEKDESFAVFNRRSTSKYRSMLPEIVKAINKGQFEKMFVPVSGASTSTTSVTELVFDSGTMEDHLSAIRRRGETQIYTDAKGRTVQVRKNVKTTYVG